MNSTGRESPPGKASGLHAIGSLLVELRKRQVFKAAGAYAVIAWGITEVLDGLVSQFGWPEWIAALAVIVFITGFPVAMFLAFVLDWTRQGLEREEPWRAKNWISVSAACLFLVSGSALLFWLINPAQVVRQESAGVAVLPCRYTGAPEFEFRAEGIAGVINDLISHVPEFRVPDYSAVVSLADQNLQIGDWKRSAGLVWLIECRLVQQSGNWRLEASLVDVAADRSEPLLSREVPESDLASIVSVVARAVEARLDEEAGPSAIPTGRYTPFPRGFDAYLKGEQAMRSNTLEGFRDSRALFRQAQEGPGMDLARVREADAWIKQLRLDLPEKPRERIAAFHAIGLVADSVGPSPDGLAESYVLRIRLATFASELGLSGPPDAELMRNNFEHAISKRPSYFEAYTALAGALRQAGRHQEADRMLQEAGRYQARKVMGSE